MSSTWTIAIISLVIIIVAPVLLSYVIEAIRSIPATPTRLPWAPEVAIRYSKVDNINLRYIVVGQGPPLVLLHTLRTQLDIFCKIIPELSQHFQVYALDYPGHGYSDIPEVDYTPEFFTTSVSAFLETMDIKDAIVGGESIGGSISVLLATKHNPRVKKVISINPYDI
jgi:pimeloyl-ACP methyl ester carboxylesterase